MSSYTDTLATTTANTIQAGNADTFTVTITERGWIDIRNNPARQIDPTAKLDFLRVVAEDENYFRLIQLTHNECIKGEATFSGALAGAMYEAIATFFETL